MAPMTKRIRASVNGMYSVLKKGAQRFVVLAPHLRAYGKSNDGNKVDVSKKRHAPDRFGFAASTERPKQFGEDQYGKR